MVVNAFGDRSTPFSAWTNHQFTSQKYSFETPKIVELQLLEFYKGTQANSIVASENMFNEVPAYDEEWLLMKFNVKYVSGPEVSLCADDIMWSGSDFYTNAGVQISSINSAAFSGDLAGLGQYEVSFYPGGESIVWYGILVKKTVGYPMIRLGTGYDSASYSYIYTWFSTDPNCSEPSDTVNKYNVTFNSDGGSAVASQSAVNNGKIVKPANPTKIGSNFVGWYKEIWCASVWNFSTDVLNGDTTLHAKWTARTTTSIQTTISGAQIVGNIPNGSSDYLYIPTITISVPTTTTVIKPTDLIAQNSGVVSFYTTSDFSEVNKVSNNGISINSNTLDLYTKIVSSDNSETKFYKIVFNVVNPTKKYAISKTNFIQVGSNFIATVTIDRGQAATLANPKLLLTYTLADGETQVFLTQNALIGANDIVVGAGILSVSAVLIDGNVDWKAGNPITKSAFVNIIVPVQ